MRYLLSIAFIFTILFLYPYKIFASLDSCQKALSFAMRSSFYLSKVHPYLLQKRVFSQYKIIQDQEFKLSLTDKKRLNNLLLNRNNLPIELLLNSLGPFLESRDLNPEKDLKSYIEKHPGLFIYPYHMAKDAYTLQRKKEIASLIVKSFEQGDFFALDLLERLTGPVFLFFFQEKVFLDALENWSNSISSKEISYKILKKIKNAIYIYKPFVEALRFQIVHQQFPNNDFSIFDEPTEEEISLQISYVHNLNYIYYLNLQIQKLEHIINLAIEGQFKQESLRFEKTKEGIKELTLKLFKEKKFYEIDTLLSNLDFLDEFDIYDILEEIDEKYLQNPRDLSLLLLFSFQQTSSKYKTNFSDAYKDQLYTDIHRFLQMEENEVPPTNDLNYLGNFFMQRFLVTVFENWVFRQYFPKEKSPILFDQSFTFFIRAFENNSPNWKAFFHAIFDEISIYVSASKNEYLEIKIPFKIEGYEFNSKLGITIINKYPHEFLNDLIPPFSEYLDRIINSLNVNQSRLFLKELLSLTKTKKEIKGSFLPIIKEKLRTMDVK